MEQDKYILVLLNIIFYLEMHQIMEINFDAVSCWFSIQDTFSEIKSLYNFAS